MKKLLILGSKAGVMDIIKYAKGQGIYTIVTDYLNPEKARAKLMADEYWMISTADVDILEEKCIQEGINGIVCGASEFHLEMAMELCERLDFPCYCTKSAWHYSRNKADFKNVCKELRAPVAEDYYLSDRLSEEELDKVIFPVVVKPVDMYGNRGVSYCSNKEELIRAYRHAQSISANPAIIVEKMLHGEEWYAYYAMADGEMTLVALNAMYAQPGEPKNCYSITTTVSNYVERFVEEVNPKIIQVLKKCGCKEGIGWVQVMLDEDGAFYIIEMGYRLDGDMMFVPYKELPGFDSVQWLVDYALGKKHAVSDLPSPQKHAFSKCACAYMLWTNKGGKIAEITGLDSIAEIPGVSIDMAKYVGDEAEPYGPIGNILFCADNCREMCGMIAQVNSRLRVKNIDGDDILIYYTDFDYLNGEYKKGLEAGRNNEDK